MVCVPDQGLQGARWAQRLSYYRVYRTTTTEHNYVFGSIPPDPWGGASNRLNIAWRAPRVAQICSKFFRA